MKILKCLALFGLIFGMFTGQVSADHSILHVEEEESSGPSCDFIGCRDYVPPEDTEPPEVDTERIIEYIEEGGDPVELALEALSATEREAAESAIAKASKTPPGGLVPCEGAGCNACHIVQLGENLFEYLVGILTVVFAIIIAYAGFSLVTSGGNPQAKEDAKKKLTNAVIGFIIVLAAWLLVDTLMKAILAGGQGEIGDSYGPWNKIECVGQATTTAAVRSVGQTGEGLSADVVQNQFSSAGITVVSSGNCTDPTNSTCTGLEGMKQRTVEAVLDVNEACPDCDIVLTGGTEQGIHRNSCHENGTCADIDCRGQCSPFQIERIIRSAEEKGYRAVYEVRSQQELGEILAATELNDNDVLIVNHMTGDGHFSLYAE